MKKYFYSKKENSFYPNELLSLYISNGTLPNDIVEVNEGCFIEYATIENPQGKVRVGSDDGFPSWGKKPEPEIEQQRENAKLKKIQLLNVVSGDIAILQDAVELGMSSDGDENKLKKLRIYRVKLSQVDVKLGDLSEFPLYPA